MSINQPETSVLDEGRFSDLDPAQVLVLTLEGYEGPLDALLFLAREQKVNLAKLSMLKLAEQYLTFIESARDLSMELAGDYLVMAAWLAYMKSRLLLPPDDEDEEPSGEELAAQLAFRLRRLEAMRTVSAQLLARNQMGENVFPRGAPEGIHILKRSIYSATLYDLLKSYCDHRNKKDIPTWQPKKRAVLSLTQARKQLEDRLGLVVSWERLETFLPKDFLAIGMPQSALASTLGASLDLVRDGRAELRQLGAFAPLYVRPAQRDSTAEEESPVSTEENSTQIEKTDNG
ncbi:MAG: ScpA family protein [Parvularculales bacterium]